METLEKELREGGLLSIQALNNSQGFITGLSGRAHSTKGYCIETAFKNFEGEYFIKMPDISSEVKLNKRVSQFLEKGYEKLNANLGTIFCLKFDAKRGLYISTLEIQNFAWINYIKDNPNDPFFSRELIFGKSKKNFTEAYSKMGEFLKDIESKPL